MKSLALLAGLMVTVAAVAQDLPDKQTPLPEKAKVSGVQYLTPRELNRIPASDFGDKIRYGYQLFVNTQTLRGIYVGDELNCVNCHMDAGRKANASPFWAAYFAYPAYRKKNDKVNSFAERIQGCFNYSMNGKAPPTGSPELIALSAYSYWLAMGGLMDSLQIEGEVTQLTDMQLLKGGKVDDFPMPEAMQKTNNVDAPALVGRGYPKIPTPAEPYSIERGAEVYQAHCLVCHGSQGQGLSIAGLYALPPLWGAQSFNWGAGMHRVNTAAFFISENMPFGKSIQLSNQQSWDVAAYINANERPQDPRFKDSIAALKDKYHKHQCYFGQVIGDGAMLGDKSFANFPPLNQ